MRNNAVPPTVDVENRRRELDEPRRLPMAELQHSPNGRPRSPTYCRWAGSEDIAAQYGPAAAL